MSKQPPINLKQSKTHPNKHQITQTHKKSATKQTNTNHQIHTLHNQTTSRIKPGTQTNKPTKQHLKYQTPQSQNTQNTTAKQVITAKLNTNKRQNAIIAQPINKQNQNINQTTSIKRKSNQNQQVRVLYQPQIRRFQTNITNPTTLSKTKC